MTTKDKKKAHLLGFIQHSGVNSHATGMWRHPKDKVGWSFSTPEYWQHMARDHGARLFDAMFIADELAPYNTHERQLRCECANGRCNARPMSLPRSFRSSPPQPSILVSADLVDCVRHPYSMCRRLSSLDHLSEGRIAWNIVSSYSKSEWDAYGHSMTGSMRPLRAAR